MAVLTGTHDRPGQMREDCPMDRDLRGEQALPRHRKSSCKGPVAGKGYIILGNEHTFFINFC